jgi:hypothetical protein
MTNLSKFIYAMMLAVSLTTITFNLIVSNYSTAIMAAGTLLWVGAAFVSELRCVKLQKQIDKLNGNN